VGKKQVAVLIYLIFHLLVSFDEFGSLTLNRQIAVDGKECGRRQEWNKQENQGQNAH